MIASSVSPRRASGPRAGFALLITVTLLAFLVLLLVSLASLTRVETQVAANNQQLAQARQNALMALNIALGELQKYAGPDQRTTARSDMDAALVSTSVKSGRWIGVYGGGVSANYNDTPTQIAAKIAADAAAGPANGSQARLLNWLVSGNEGTAFDPVSAVAADGRISTAPASFAFKPTDPVANLAGSPTVAGKAARLLVGPGTVGASVNDYVAAPVVNIDADAGQVPGFSGGATIGRYAWWVGDENAKARINLPLVQDAAQLPQAFVNASRAAVELVDGANVEGAADTAPANAAANRLASYDPAASAEVIPRLLNTNQLEMLGANAAAVTALTTARKYRFHDLTAASSSVLADTYAGGLKKDLSALLATGSASPAAGDFLFKPQAEVASSPITTRASTNTYGVPTWGLLRSFATTRTPATGELTPRLPTATQAGISPVLTNAGVGMQYVSDGAPGDPIHLALYPIAVLWNPYTAKLKGRKYEFGVTRRYSATLQLQASTPSRTSPWTIKETRDFLRGGGLVTGGAAPNADGSANVTSTVRGTVDPSAGVYLRFVIDASNVDLEPGQSVVFTLPAGRQTYNAPDGGEPANELKRGLRVTSHAVMPSASSVEAGETTYRVAIYGANDAYRTMFSPAVANASFQGGESDAYLGEVSSVGPDGYGLESPNGRSKPWYQSISRSYSGSIGLARTPAGSDTLLKDVSTLSAFTSGPDFGIFLRSQFSTAGRRWIAQGNPRAPLQTRSPLNEGLVPGVYGYAAGGQWQGFTADAGGSDRVSSGVWLNAGSGITDTTLFEYRPDSQPLLSLGQLQHANLSMIGTYPSYAVGNSLADYRFRDSYGNANPAIIANDYLGNLVRTDGMPLTSVNNDNAPSQLMTAYYDVSYLLNRALWDRYFLSTVPHAGTGISTDTDLPLPTVIPAVLPNPRHVRQDGAADADLRDGDKAAAGLMLAGGFNINSTSEQAWRAVLGGINQLAYDPAGGSPASALKAALPRFAKPTSTLVAASRPWQGYRQLTEPQIAQLARNIVTEIRNRGPFVSLGDFVNRRLRDNPATTPPSSAPILNADERFKGVIQSALDATPSGATAINTGTSGAVTAAAPFTTTGTYFANNRYAYLDGDLMRGGPATVAPYSSYSAFAPQFLTQADVLSAIGAGLSARSDTFVIRTYGETVNPADSTEVAGRAWCEAVVQRIVEPVRRKSTLAASADYNEPAVAAAGQPDFGRRFKIVSFRWLTANDI